MSKKTQIPYSPLPGYVLAKPITEKHSLDLPIVEEGFPQLAVVLKVGAPVYRDYTDTLVSSPVAVGQKIVHSTYFEKFRYQGEELRIVSFSKILLVYDE